MIFIPVKNTNDTYTAAEFTGWNQEAQNHVLSTGQILSGANQFQSSIASSTYAAGSTFYADTGAANTYVLSPIGTLQTPISYTNGMEIRFVPANANTGASTVNVDGLGVKDIATKIGDTLQGTQLRTGIAITLHFDTANDEFRLVNRDTPMNGALANTTITATTTDVSVGIIVVRDSTNTLDIILDTPLTKQLNNPFALGDAAGGRATGVPLVVGEAYNVFLVYNAATGVTDIGFDTSESATNLLATAPTFTHFRRIWTVRTEFGSTNIVDFVKFGNRCQFITRQQITVGDTGLQAGPTFTSDLSVVAPKIGQGITGLFSMIGEATAVGGGGTLFTHATTAGLDDRLILIGQNQTPNQTLMSEAFHCPVRFFGPAIGIRLFFENTSGNFQFVFNLEQHGWIDNLGRD